MECEPKEKDFEDSEQKQMTYEEHCSTDIKILKFCKYSSLYYSNSKYHYKVRVSCTYSSAWT